MEWFNFHFSDFAFSFLSILFEGIPFLLLGAVIAGFVDVFVPARWLTQVLPKNPTAAVFLSGLLGIIFPMCECGSVIVIRRFLTKGLPVSSAVAYMLAAPIVSPIVAISTFAAFRGQNPWMMTSMRLLIGYGVAVGAALIVQRLPLEKVLARALYRSLPPRDGGAGPEAAIDDGGAGVATRARRRKGRKLRIAAVPQGEEGIGTKLLRVARSTTPDFLDVTLFFVIGAAVAALFNTAIDQSVILPLASNTVLATLSMMGLASLLALCSSTDAFIAATFVAFPFTAKLAFLVFGPLVDVKLFFLYGLVFRRRFIVLLSIGLFVAVALICLRMNVLDM
ncbi:MAG TPA: permease [Chthoniobacteraceae bacterium]|nr:permease [Chthoniobacteraceae bacterium]